MCTWLPSVTTKAPSSLSSHRSGSWNRRLCPRNEHQQPYVRECTDSASPQVIFHAVGIQSCPLGIRHVVVGEAMSNLADGIGQTRFNAVENLRGEGSVLRRPDIEAATEGGRTAPNQTK